MNENFPTSVRFLLRPNRSFRAAHRQRKKSQSAERGGYFYRESNAGRDGVAIPVGAFVRRSWMTAWEREESAFAPVDPVERTVFP